MTAYDTCSPTLPSTMQSSASFTDLATLFILVISSAIILRRRFRRRVEEALANGLFFDSPPPPGPPIRVPGEKPVLHDAWSRATCKGLIGPTGGAHGVFFSLCARMNDDPAPSPSQPRSPDTGPPLPPPSTPSAPPRRSPSARTQFMPMPSLPSPS
ncbi:hypothetical protein BV22DRAFT_1192533 [Leucogyrophana mollusca]|uniref:Uncharacterized protein n=1 Tax=Leucogyrophana mollusca TaxID=85980 RepID=A0ACB8BT87_9AGAM|nr:hypothetical protein BV22DRAFT_1192533 [Leucogyrophana mollusca]